MAKKEEGALSRVWGAMFGTKVTREGLIDDYRKKVAKADRKIRDYDYDRREKQRELDLIIQKGRKASSESDTSAMVDAAMRLKLTRARLSQISAAAIMLRKVQYLHEKAIFHLEVTADTEVGELVRSLQQMTENSSINEMLTDSNLDFEKFVRTVDREFSMAVGNLSDRSDIDLHDLQDEMNTFRELDAAVKSGDEKRAAELQAKLSGEGKMTFDAASLLDDLS